MRHARRRFASAAAVERTKTGFRFRGRGFGHGAGLRVVGAGALAAVTNATAPVGPPPIRVSVHPTVERFARALEPGKRWHEVR